MFGLPVISTKYKCTDDVTDLALTISRTTTAGEFQVVSILLILVVTIYFCHSLIRLCMLAFKSPSRSNSRPLAHLVRYDGHARPEQRRRLFTENMETGGYSSCRGDEEKDLERPPPVYGIWRNSVVSRTSVRL